jgi:hypothetical protein
VRDGAKVFALHTSPIKAVALPMYERMGFNFLHDAPALPGVPPYAIYLKSGLPGKISQAAGRTGSFGNNNQAV